MTVNHRKKIRRQRGSRNCGWGLTHRGGGNRGGRGNAGSGKRADCKKPSNWDRVFGRHGFISRSRTVPDITINLKDITANTKAWLAEKLIEESAGELHIDLGKLGYTKLLGTGKAARKMHIKVAKAAKGAADKVAAAGGKVETAALSAAE
jgi:large subunit ribosomal protein L15